MSGRIEHVSDARLHKYLLGKLTDADLLIVEEHLDLCAACSEKATQLSPSDPFVQLLQTAHVPNGRGSAGELLATFAHVDPSTDAVPAAPPRHSTDKNDLPNPEDLPEELQNHNRYRVQALISQGGMGRVWRAQHLVLNRQVALKTLRSELIDSLDTAERFYREIQAAAKLSHPNIAIVYDAEKIGNTHFLVMEYVEGSSLAELVNLGPLPVAEACRVARDVARGLAHAHAAKLIHRDVKPGNLMRTPNQTIKLLDFGLAVGPQGASSTTSPNMILGTPDYISPEQADDPRSADERSDIYSLGCTLYHLLAGKPPFAGTLRQKLNAHATELPTPIDGIEEEVWAVLAKLMAKRPEDRIATASEVEVALAPFCDEPFRRPSTSAAFQPKPKPRLQSRRFGLIALLSGAGLTLMMPYRWFVAGPQRIKSPRTESESDQSMPTLSTANSDSVPQEQRQLLREPFSIGDGAAEDFQVAGPLLVLDSLSRNWQVWLNYDYDGSSELSIRLHVRVLKRGDDSIFKIALLFQQDAELDLVLRLSEGKAYLHRRLKSRPAQVLAGHDLDSSALSGWTAVEFSKFADQLTCSVGKSVKLNASVRDTSTPNFVCLSVQQSLTEVFDARVVKLV